MQEEEAALLSLGAVLKWETIVADEAPCGFWFESALLFTGNTSQDYTIEVNPERSPQINVQMCYWLSDGPTDEIRQQFGGKCWYNTVAEAKAACELHMATGQFPLGVEPELLNVEQEQEEGLNP